MKRVMKRAIKKEIKKRVSTAMKMIMITQGKNI
jgi:hypothetical protein